MTTPRPRLARLAVAAVMVPLLATQTPAHAEGLPLDSRLCQPLPSTPATQIPTMWHLERLRMQQVWQLATGEGVTIAVIDTGTSPLNSALLDPQKVTTLNYVPLEDEETLTPRGVGDSEQGISCAHGTSVTSLIVGTPGVDTRTSYSGIAPGARVLAMRALRAQVDDEGAAQKEDPRHTVEAINDAVARKVDIINISQAMSEGTPEYAAAIKNAIDHGIVVVAAAGNGSQKLRGPAYPAAYPGVIAVGLSNPQDIAPAGSGHSDPAMEITVAAPGVGVLALGPTRAPAAGRTSQQDLLTNQSYVSGTGTSYSTPIVSGVVALMLQRDPELTPAQVKQRLIETADPPVGAVPDPYLGHGVVNPLRALTGPAAPTAGHPSSSTSPEAIPAREPLTTDRSGMTTALIATAGALLLAGGGLLLKLVIPAADKRGYRPAAPPRPRN